MSEDDLQYFERRRRECIERASSSRDPHLVAVYRSFAVHYMRVLQAHTAAAKEDEAA